MISKQWVFSKTHLKIPFYQIRSGIVSGFSKVGFEENYGLNALKKLIKDSNHSRTVEKTSSPRLNVMDVWAPYIVIFGFLQIKFFKICERIVFLMRRGLIKKIVW